ncbi:MAG: HemK2/MTQ2 family protein methyltransferase, partial [Candidatus Helarchaeota archaeon]
MKYLDCEFKIFDNVYKPSDDSLLLAENLEVMPEDRILEIGIGCGILSILAAKCGAKVVGIDISIIAAKCSKYNSQINKVRQNLNIIVGDLMNPLKKSQKFDLIIFNPPYLPELRLTDSIIERAWNGGKKGNEIILRFIKEIKDYLSENGRIL